MNTPKIYETMALIKLSGLLPKIPQRKPSKFQLIVVKRITLLMSSGAFIWIIGMISTRTYELTIIPASYLVLSGLNYFLNKKEKLAIFGCNLQIGISILLPVMFQLAAGGVMATGAVALWSTVALFGISTFTPSKRTFRWTIFTIILIGGSILFEHTKMYNVEPIIDIDPLKLLIFNATGSYFTIFYVGYFFVTTVETIRDNLKKAIKQSNELNTQLKDRNEQYTEGLVLASDIQNSFLKAEDHLRTVFTKSFLMGIPKEYITGNFIWTEQKSNLKYIICGECNSKGTSRGVLAMLLVSVADRILREHSFTDPTEFLYKFKEYLVEDSSLDLDKLNASVFLSMIIINAETNKAKVSLAGGSVIVRSPNGKTMRHYVETGFLCCDHKQSNFVSKDLNLKIGDQVYMHTDGFINQSNEHGENFGSQRFEELLSKLDTEYAFMQKRKLAKVFKQWQSRAKQNYDVLVCGFEIEDPALVYDLKEDTMEAMHPYEQK